MSKDERCSVKSEGKHSLTFIVAINLAIVILVLAAFEASIVLLLNYPPPVTLALRVLSSYYTDYDRTIIQAQPACATYDSELAYLLRPGSCKFENYDFDTIVNVNSLGLRDDEESLISPEVIALGDSITMGWGVSNNESFPQLIEKDCRIRTLNAGVSSYGTVRSLHLLKRLDRTKLRVLLVQYQDNDVSENMLFMERKNQLITMAEEDFSSMQSRHVESLKYWPGKHITQFVPFAANRIGERINSQLSAKNVFDMDGADKLENKRRRLNHSLYFLNAFRHILNLDSDLRIIVFRINGRDKNNAEFANMLRRKLDIGNYDDPVHSMEVLDFSKSLTRDKFFVLDDHISAEGHRLVANMLIERLECER